MSFEKALVARLSADPEVLHFVYNTADEGLGEDEQATAYGVRIWRNRPKAGVYPCIVYRRLGTEPTRTLQGPGGLTKVSVEVECWSSANRDEIASRLADRVRVLLDRDKNSSPDNNGAWEAAGVRVASCKVVDAEDRLRKPPGEKDAIWPTVLLDVEAWFYENTTA